MKREESSQVSGSVIDTRFTNVKMNPMLLSLKPVMIIVI